MKEQMPIAVELAIRHHAEQKYGELPYIIHLAEVDRLVVQVYAPKEREHSEPYSKRPGDEMDNLRAIAFLHDIIEDTAVTSLDLAKAGITWEVIAAVEAMTKVKGEKYDDYIHRVLQNPLAVKVKLCDTSANLMNNIKEGNTKGIMKYTNQLQILGGF